MSNGKYSKRKSGKAIVALVALVMILAIGIGGTLAYLTDSKEVTNTFVVGDIGELKLEEKDSTSKVDGKYLIVPGVDITKDPKVSYAPDAKAGEVDVPVYVFVQVTDNGWTKTDDANTYQVLLNDSTPVMSWTVADGWALLEGEEHVYFKALAKGQKIENVSVINGDTIHVEDTEITKDNIATIANSANNLSFKAYVIQQNSFADAAAAWEAIVGA